jgi:6-phosphogluconate dehydrogenase (decarboxylating)
MELAMIGLGQDGRQYGRAAAARRPSRRRTQPLARAGAPPPRPKGPRGRPHSLEMSLSRLSAPRVVWLMLPAGQVTEDALLLLSGRAA